MHTAAFVLTCAFDFFSIPTVNLLPPSPNVHLLTFKPPLPCHSNTLLNLDLLSALLGLGNYEEDGSQVPPRMRCQNSRCTCQHPLGFVSRIFSVLEWSSPEPSPGHVSVKGRSSLSLDAAFHQVIELRVPLRSPILRRVQGKSSPRSQSLSRDLQSTDVFSACPS